MRRCQSNWVRTYWFAPLQTAWIKQYEVWASKAARFLELDVSCRLEERPLAGRGLPTDRREDLLISNRLDVDRIVGLPASFIQIARDGYYIPPGILKMSTYATDD